MQSVLLQILNYGGAYRVGQTVWSHSQEHRGWSHGIGGPGLSCHWASNGTNDVVKLSGNCKNSIILNYITNLVLKI